MGDRRARPGRGAHRRDVVPRHGRARSEARPEGGDAWPRLHREDASDLDPDRTLAGRPCLLVATRSRRAAAHCDLRRARDPERPRAGIDDRGRIPAVQRAGRQLDERRLQQRLQRGRVGRQQDEGPDGGRQLRRRPWRRWDLRRHRGRPRDRRRVLRLDDHGLDVELAERKPRLRLERVPGLPLEPRALRVRASPGDQDQRPVGLCVRASRGDHQGHHEPQSQPRAHDAVLGGPAALRRQQQRG